MKASKTGIVTLVVILLLIVGCGGGGGTITSSTPPPQAGTRSYLLAQTGMQIVPFKGFKDASPDLATDTDLISIHNDFYGVPWDEFAAGQTPPLQWTQLMDGLAQNAASSGKDVFLTLALVENGMGRQYLADKAVVVNGTLSKSVKWSQQCYDFASAPDGAAMQTAYVRYVDWMMREFKPRYVNVAAEINLFLTCPQGWDGLVQVERAAYDSAKAVNPSVVAFPSIQIDQLYGLSADCPTPQKPDLCYESNYARLALLKRDRFGVSTYPDALSQITDVSKIAGDWFTRAADRGGESVVIAETGWISDSPVSLGPSGCFQSMTHPGAFTEAQEAAYLDRLLNDAQARHWDLVTYWSNRDLVPQQFMTSCPCSFDATWCTLLDLFRNSSPDPLFGELAVKRFGTMGIRRYDGTPKALVFQRWQQALALRVNKSP